MTHPRAFGESSLPIVAVTPAGARRLRHGHPWIFRSDVASAEGAVGGALVAVRLPSGELAGLATFSDQGQLALRMTPLSVERGETPAAAEARLFALIDASVARRRDRPAACRLVNGDADGFPGLIVDRYGEAISLQCLTQAAARRQGAIVDRLRALTGARLVVARDDVRVRAFEGLPLEKSVLVSDGPKTRDQHTPPAWRPTGDEHTPPAWRPAGDEHTPPAWRPTGDEHTPPAWRPTGDHTASGLASTGELDPANVTVDLLGLRLSFDLLEGQKTGGFLDQTDNRAAAAARAHGEALDCFCYDGGFSLSLARAGCAVTAVDSSAPALERLRRRAADNGLHVEAVEENVFDLLRVYEREGRRFDTIVLDPPAFAKSRDAVEAGRRAYKEINLRALKILRPGGLLVTCSCSAHMDRAGFERMLAEAAADARRFVRILERRSAAPDHPTLVTAPETDYLKVLIAEAH